MKLYRITVEGDVVDYTTAIVEISAENDDEAVTAVYDMSARHFDWDNGLPTSGEFDVINVDELGESDG